MAVGLLGNKIGMTQIFDESGNIIPVTILKAGPCIVTQIKTKLKDGYDAIQVGYNYSSNKSLTQPELGHLQKSNIRPLRYLKEFRIDNEIDFEVGQVIDVALLSAGQFVTIKGKTIGKGFSGLQKRHNFTRGHRRACLSSHCKRLSHQRRNRGRCAIDLRLFEEKIYLRSGLMVWRSLKDYVRSKPSNHQTIIPT